jgi:hypothetical protein
MNVGVHTCIGIVLSMHAHAYNYQYKAYTRSKLAVINIIAALSNPPTECTCGYYIGILGIQYC